MNPKLRTNTSERIEGLLKGIRDRGTQNRSSEWFRQEEVDRFMNLDPEEAVIIRKARATNAMLCAMTDPQISNRTGSFEMEEHDLLCGVLPMGSNGLGKIFPNYLTEDERRVGTITNKTALALLGHNSINYSNLLSGGLRKIITFCQEQIEKPDPEQSISMDGSPYRKEDFYRAVIISCEAVVDFANRWAERCDELAESASGQRREELLEMGRICRKVPYEPADTFHEAIQSIWFFHLSLHASANYMSLGRLDQVLNPYLEREADLDFAQELVENFVIKGAWRLNLTTEYLAEQDHMDYNAALGIHPYYLDQRAGTNNFLQNIIVGGKKPTGEDATTPCTLLFIQAYENVNLSTPGLYVRLHKESPECLLNKVAECLERTNNLPNILNDDVLIPAMRDALCTNEDLNEEVPVPWALKRYFDNPEEARATRGRIYQMLANDYCVDGCWEPILNGCSYWTFGMLNGMTILECALNNGATLSPNPELLRGQKLSTMTGEITSFQQLMEVLKVQIQFFTDQSALPMYQNYLLNEFVVPSPLFSSMIENCLATGRDISWGGAAYNIGGTILGGVPDMVNTLAAIQKWCNFEGENRDKDHGYSMEDICSALRYNFLCGNESNVKQQERFDEMKVDFRTDSPQFGNNEEEADRLTRQILDMFAHAVGESKKLADKVFIDIPSESERPRIEALRHICGYLGEAVRKSAPSVDIKFTAGMGTFEQYNWQGASNSASASRESGAPLAPNFTPVSGTMDHGIGSFFESLSKCGMERFAGGVISDVCLDEAYKDPQTIRELIKSFIACNGNMLTLTIGSRSEYQTIYELAVAATKINDKKFAARELANYSGINVRVGGWQAPFITLPLSHMQNYVQRPAAPSQD